MALGLVKEPVAMGTERAVFDRSARQKRCAGRTGGKRHCCGGNQQGRPAERAPDCGKPRDRGPCERDEPDKAMDCIARQQGACQCSLFGIIAHFLTRERQVKTQYPHDLRHQFGHNCCSPGHVGFVLSHHDAIALELP